MDKEKTNNKLNSTEIGRNGTVHMPPDDVKVCSNFEHHTAKYKTQNAHPFVSLNNIK